MRDRGANGVHSGAQPPNFELWGLWGLCMHRENGVPRLMPSLREAPLQVSSVAVVGADDTIDLSRQPTRHAPTAHSPDVPSEPTLDHLSRPPRGRPRPHTLLAR